MIRALGLLVLAGWASAATAQSLSGLVEDETRRPVPGATVLVPRLDVGTITNAQGRFTLSDLPADTLTVRVSFLGFEPVWRQVDLRTGDAQLNVVLTPVLTKLDEVVVTEDATVRDLTIANQPLAVLDARELDLERGGSFGELLDGLAGVTLLTTGPTVAKPVIRGLHSDRVRIINAGVPQEGQQWGGEHAPEIDPFSPNRIEVLKGAAGVEYGVGAIGGVIRVEPRPLRSTPGLAGAAHVSGHSNNWLGAGGLLLEGGSGQLPGLGWRVQGSTRVGGNARTPDYALSNTGFRESSLNTAVGFQRDRFGVEVLGSHFATTLGVFRGAHIGNLTDLQRAIDRGRPSTNPGFTFGIDPPKQDVAHTTLSARGFYRLKPSYRLEAQYSYQRNDRKEFDAHRPLGSNRDPNKPAFDLLLQTHTLDLKLQRGPFGRRFGTVGLSLMRQGNVNGATGILIPNFWAYTFGAFARESFVATDRLSFDVGLRLDGRVQRAWPKVRVLGRREFESDDRTYFSPTGVAGFLYRFADAWSVGVNLGSAWRPPGVNELYSDGVHHGTAQYELGDASLGPERNASLELTLRHVGPRLRFEAASYVNRFWGYIVLFPSPEPILTIRGAFPFFRYQQSDARLAGLDLTGELSLTESVTLGLKGSLLRADDLDADEPLFMMPANRIGGHIDWTGRSLLGVREPTLSVQLEHVGQQTRVPEGVDYTDPPAAYTLLGLETSGFVPFGPVSMRVSFEVTNLLDARYRDFLSRYRYYADDPGRSFIIRLSLPFGDQ